MTCPYPRHDVVIWANHDGVIEVTCTCGWTQPLAAAPSPSTAWRAEQRHLADVAEPDRIPPVGTLVAVTADEQTTVHRVEPSGSVIVIAADDTPEAIDRKVREAFAPVARVIDALRNPPEE